MASLRPFGFASVAGLRARPRLVMGDVACRILFELSNVNLSKVEATAVEPLARKVEPRWQPHVNMVRSMKGGL